MRYASDFQSKNKEKGFTLIELLVVIAIIGLLASIVLASLSGARAKAQNAKTIEEVAQYQTALVLYYNDNGGYPNPGTGVPYCLGPANSCEWNGTVISNSLAIANPSASSTSARALQAAAITSYIPGTPSVTPDLTTVTLPGGNVMAGAVYICSVASVTKPSLCQDTAAYIYVVTKGKNTSCGYGAVLGTDGVNSVCYQAAGASTNSSDII